MRGKIIEHIITGLGLGFVITTICLWAFGVYEANGITVMRQYTTWLVASALYGLISLIYDSDVKFPLSLAIHFGSCAAVTFVASFVSGLFEFMRLYEWFIYVLPVFCIIYAVTGAVVTLVAKCQIKKINDKVKKKNLK